MPANNYFHFTSNTFYTESNKIILSEDDAFVGKNTHHTNNNNILYRIARCIHTRRAHAVVDNILHDGMRLNETLTAKYIRP